MGMRANEVTAFAISIHALRKESDTFHALTRS